MLGADLEVHNTYPGLGTCCAALFTVALLVCHVIFKFLCNFHRYVNCTTVFALEFRNDNQPRLAVSL